MSLLEVKSLKVSYGGINAVKGIDLHVDAGELVALIGANGAGKTTTLKAICGLLQHAGHVRYGGDDVSNLPSYQLVERGLALVPEGRGVFGRLTVAENLEMGAYVRREKAAIRQDMQHVYKLFPRLAERRAQTAGTLSGGEQQMLAIGRALMSQPKLLLLDEPSMGLAPMMVERIFEVEAANRGYVMESGTITLTGEAGALLDNPQVRQAYLGE
jgi:branched-chain amino acid transport system ATP-binding protein